MICIGICVAVCVTLAVKIIRLQEQVGELKDDVRKLKSINRII